MALNTIDSIVSKSYPNFIKNIKHYFHRIEFAAIITNEDGTTTVIDLSNVIVDFKIFHLYNAFVFPVVATSVNLTPKQHITIADNLERVQFRLNLEKLETTDISDASKALESTADSVYKNIMLELSDYDKKRFRDESENYESGFEDATKIHVYLELFKAEHLDINKKPLNGIYNNVNIDSLLIHLLSKANQKMLVQKANRTEPLKQVLLPNKNLVQTIYYLQDTYGVYKSGIRLFFDFDRGYCLTHDIANNEPISEKEPYEYKNVICYIGRSATDNTGCWLDEDTKTYYLLLPNSDQFVFSDKSAKDLYGNKLIFQSFSQDNKTMSTNTLNNNYSVENSSSNKDKLKIITTSTNKDYVIKSGDTLSAIAKSYDITVAEIMAVNSNIKDTDKIYTGQTISIPITTTTTETTSTPLSTVISGVPAEEKDEKVKYYYNNLTNNYAEQELLSLITRNELKYVATIKDIDLFFLSMNKTIYLSFIDESYSDYNGMYEIEGMATAFTKIGTRIYETDSIITFTRLTKDFLAYS